MGVPRPTRDKAEGDRHTVASDADRASRVSESSTADAQDMPDVSAPPPGETPRTDIHDLPRNEAFRHGAIGSPAGSQARSTWMPADASATPSAAPPSASTTPSTRSAR